MRDFLVKRVFMSNLLSYVESLLSAGKRDLFPDFSAGDTVSVHVKVKEDTKERVQKFIGTVIQRKNKSTQGETFTVLKLVEDVAVERIFPILSPIIEKIELLRKGSVRRARIYYLRDLRGRSAKVKERLNKKKKEG